MPEISSAVHLPEENTSWSCPTCKGPVATTWLFCQSCGTDFRVSRPNQLAAPIPLQPTAAVVSPPLLPTQPVPTAPAAQTSVGLLERLRDRLPEAPRGPHLSANASTWVKAFSGLLALLLIGAALTVHLQTRADLHRTERTLADTKDQLSGVQTDLAASRATLVGTKGDLENKSAELDETQGSLDDANDKLNLQTDQIEDLRECLGGVQTAFSYFLDYYYDSALSRLYAVQASCDRAYALF
ncbi:hypothetical protein [Kineosporia babensis]|uniref:Uncharacterized protein n=1 Tax=Kineosporia babensis TaxID=499548 RepID=A0A9X1N6S1_9ACTN|nr:hypothetical protein [Kineosporia babensis]MCD5309382.1 hypothetical protein [Kineosporia babensis]